MKRHILLIALLLPSIAWAQDGWDALRFSELKYQGTARSMALGNAMTSIGGDFGAISINPAGSAVFPYSEISATASLSLHRSQMEFPNNSAQFTREKRDKMSLPSLGYVGSISTRRTRGLTRITFAVGYNKVADFNSRSAMRTTGQMNSWLSPVAMETNGIYYDRLQFSDYDSQYNPYYESGATWRGVMAWNAYLLDRLPDRDNEYIAATENLTSTGIPGEYDIMVGGPLDQRFSRETTGNMGEYLLNVGFNINDRIYAGANLTLQNVYYSSHERYTETTQHPEQFDTQLQSFSHTYKLTTNGMGANLKLGVIARITNHWRIGASLTTPTVLSLTDEWQESLEANFRTGSEQVSSPIGSYDYRVTTPLRFSVGTSLTLSNIGLLSIDYEGVDYSSMRMGEKRNSFAFESTNDAIHYGSNSYQFNYAHVLRMGAEFRILSLAIRGGYNYYSAPERSLSDSHVYSVGIGYRSNGFHIDLAGAFTNKTKDRFVLYDSDPQIYGNHFISNSRILCTIGFRF